MREIYIFLFLTNILFLACSEKNADEFVAYPNDPQNDTVWVNQPAVTSPVNKIPEQLSFSPKEDSFEVAAGANIRFSDILTISFPSSAVTFANGTPVTGKVKVEVTHLSKKGDIIRFALQTISHDKLLATGGAFLIRVTKGGQELILDPVKNITLWVRDANLVNNMKVFYGEQVLQPPVPLALNATFTWAPSPDLSDVNVVSGTYELNSKRLNWISCNYSIDDPQAKSKTTVVLPLNFTNKNTLVFAVLKDQKAVLQLEGHGASKNFTVDDIPSNNNITLVAIAKVGEDFYLGTKETTVEKNLRENITPVKRTKAEVEQFLDAL